MRHLPARRGGLSAACRTLAVMGIGLVDARELSLIGTSVFVAVGATVIALALGLPIGVRVARARSLFAVAFWSWLAALPILLPPYVYAYITILWTSPAGWLGAQLVELPEFARLFARLRAMLMLGAWLSPIPALVVAASWRTLAEPLIEQASLDLTRWAAAFRVGLPAMAGVMAGAALACLAIGLTEYTIPHLSGVQTWQTELLLDAQNAADPGDLALRSWPVFAVVGLFALAARLLVARMGSEQNARARHAVRPSWRLTALAGGCVAVTVLMPLATVLMSPRLADLADVATVTFSLRHTELIDTLITVLAAALTSVALAVVLPTRWWVLLLWASLGLLPAAVIGRTLVAHQQFWLVALDLDSTSARAFGRVHLIAIPIARYGWVAAGVIAWARLSRSREVDDLARLDGVSWLRGLVYIRAPLEAGTWLAAGLIVAGLALGEAAASVFVQPPGVGHLPMAMLNQMHYGRSDEVLLLCLVQFAISAVLTAGAVFALWVDSGARVSP